MKDQFVTYEIALKLKELGFDEGCFGYYSPGNNEFSFFNEYPLLETVLKADNSIILAPLRQQCIDWLLKEHNIFISIEDYTFVDMINDGSGYKYYINVYGCCEVGVSQSPFFNTPKLAYEHAILTSFDLIER